MTYARSHGTQQPPPTQAARQADIHHQQQQIRYGRQPIPQQHQSQVHVHLSIYVSADPETPRSQSCNLGKF
jgi:hypothetical protein